MELTVKLLGVALAFLVAVQLSAASPVPQNTTEAPSSGTSRCRGRFNGFGFPGFGGFNQGFNPGFNQGFNPGFNPGLVNPGLVNPGFNQGFNPGFTNPGFTNPGFNQGFVNPGFVNPNVNPAFG